MLRIEIFNINISVSGNLWKTMPQKQTKVGHCFLINRVKWKELYFERNGRFWDSKIYERNLTPAWSSLGWTTFELRELKSFFS